MEPTSEQKCVLECLAQGYCVNVESVAGSGKTSTSLFIARHFKERRVLLLTYNARLKFDTRDRARRSDLSNLEVHTYHSFCVTYYDPGCYRDTAIRKMLDNALPPLQQYNYDIIIIDEAQDLTFLYYELICTILGNCGREYQLCIFGDRYQSIYQYNGADVRFMLHASNLFNKCRWKTVRLTETFRLTGSMVDFVNNVMFRSRVMRTSKKRGDRVDYVICNTFKPSEIYGLLSQKKISPEDIFILAASCRSPRSPIRKFANYISDMSIPIFVSNDDDSCIDSDITRGKMVFSTFHQVKGLERKIVVVFGFDDSYHKYYNNSQTSSVANELYVACTRATERLIVLHHYKNDFLNWFKPTNTESIRLVRLKGLATEGGGNSVRDTRVATVTDITRHLLPEQVLIALGYIDFDVNLITQAEPHAKSVRSVKCPSKVKWGDLYENVSDINGTAIVAAFEHSLTGSISIDHDRRLKGKSLCVSTLLNISNRWCCECSGYKYKLNQIKSYDWMDISFVEECIERLRENMPLTGVFETSLSANVRCGAEIVRVVGSLDYIVDNKIYEFKCTDTIDMSHIIQVCLYGYLYMCEDKGNPPPTMVVYNVFYGTSIDVKVTREGLNNMVDYLIQLRYGLYGSVDLDDNDFIGKARLLSSKVGLCDDAADVVC